MIKLKRERRKNNFFDLFSLYICINQHKSSPESYLVAYFFLQFYFDGRVYEGTNMCV